ASIIGFDCNSFKSCYYCTCGVCTVGRVRDNHFGTVMVAVRFMESFDHHQRSPLSLGTGSRLQCNFIHACNLFQMLLHIMDDFQCTLDCLVILLGMAVCKTWH